MSRLGVVLGGTAAAVLLVDQVTKALVRDAVPLGRSVPLLGEYVKLTHLSNTGAAFSMLQGLPWLFAAISSAIVIASLAWWFLRRPPQLLVALGLGMGVGGAIGNLVDRALFGAVTDFIDVRIWPVFNAADSAVVVGVGLLALHILLDGEPRAEASSAEAGEPGR